MPTDLKDLVGDLQSLNKEGDNYLDFCIMDTECGGNTVHANNKQTGESAEFNFTGEGAYRDEDQSKKHSHLGSNNFVVVVPQ